MDLTIGKRIKELRKELKMTQSELAEPEMTKSMLSHIENGYANPSMKNLQYIADKLNKPVSYFFQDNRNDYRGNDNLPVDEILDNLRNIDNLIENKKYELTKEHIKQLLDSYSFQKNSKIYADIVFRLASCHINLNEFNEGEKMIDICYRVYIDNELYVDAAKTYIKLLIKPLNEYDYKKCIEILDKGYEIYIKSSSKDIFLEIKMLVTKPALYFALGDLNKTIDVCQRAISLSNKNNIYYLLDDAYRMMAITYLLQGNHDKFIINMEKAKKYVEFTNNKNSLVKIYHNYAKYKNMIKNPYEALKYLKLLDNNSGEKTFYYYLEHGKAEYLLGNYNEALDDLSRITFKEKIYYMLDCIYILTGKIYKGLIYSKLKEYDKAIKEIEDAIKEIEIYTKVEYIGFARYAYTQLSFAYDSLSEVYSLKGEYDKAYSFLKKSNDIKILSMH